MLGRDGVMLGETFSISFLLIGFFCIFLATSKYPKSFAICSGVAFALSAYFRSQFETFFMMASVVLVFISLFFMAKRTFSTVKQPLLILFIALLIFHGLTIPYRIYTYKRSGSLLWVRTSALLIRNNFYATDYLLQKGGAFVVNGAGNVACRVNEEACSRISSRIINKSITEIELKKEFIQTLTRHPVRWIYLKLQVVPRYWFSSIHRYWNFAEATQPNYPEGLVFLACFIISIAITIITLRNSYSLITFCLSTSICLAYTAIFIVAHFEVRYLFFFKFYFFVAAMLDLARFYDQSRRQGKFHHSGYHP